jgi:hypothetical protein
MHPAMTPTQSANGSGARKLRAATTLALTGQALLMEGVVRGRSQVDQSKCLWVPRVRSISTSDLFQDAFLEATGLDCTEKGVKHRHINRLQIVEIPVSNVLNQTVQVAVSNLASKCVARRNEVLGFGLPLQLGHELVEPPALPRVCSERS